MAQRDRLREVSEEFRSVVVGRSKIVDAVLPPLVFVILNALTRFEVASWGSLAVAVALGGLRLIRGEPLGYALGGLGATVLAILAALLSNRAQGYFLPNLINGGLTVVLCLGSVLVRRPLVALTSHLARGWPLKWYWHPKVRPAYGEVTLAWAVFFALRLALQWFLFQEAEAAVLGLLSVILGWPATIVLLVLSYLYGTWRLRNLDGPSVEELEAGLEPPWEGQQRGF
ncbi:MAG: DUF3159 domain-containing protein [Anaerolineae bacterium]